MAENDFISKRIEQNDPKGERLKSVKSDLMCGDQHTLSVFQPSVIIDSHMHIESGHCATLPFVWSAGPAALGAFHRAAEVSRGWVEGSGKTLGYLLEILLVPVHLLKLEKLYQKSAIRKLIGMQELPTNKIGDAFIKERKAVLEDFFMSECLYKGVSHLSLCSVVMTMDMEYAHVDGYYGLKIYNAVFKTLEDLEREEEPVAYWVPVHGTWIKAPTPPFGPLPPDEVVFEKIRRRGEDQYRRIDTEGRPAYPVTLDAFQTYKATASKNVEIIGTYYDAETGKIRQVAVSAAPVLDAETGKIRQVAVSAAPVLTTGKETKQYERWEKQLKYTELAVLKYPLKLLPMFHYDPRRWQVEGRTGNDFPLSQVSGVGLYLGFKMYTAQGYRPLDSRLPILEDFYYKCALAKIPILNHCTPGGAATFVKEEYINFKHLLDGPADDGEKQGMTGESYFNTHFVSPKAWKKVLEATVNGRSLSDLYLCLAHFGGPTEEGLAWNRQIIEMICSGDYPNLYTDISSSFASEDFRTYFKGIISDTAKPNSRRLKERILFGTDWYMTFVYSSPLSGMDFDRFCRTAKPFLDDFDTSLWPHFTQYNPYRFYRLDKNIDRIKDNIIVKRHTDKVRVVLGEVDADYIPDTEKEAAWLKVANKGYVDYEETLCK
jgi:hypothetical protein